MGAQVIFHAVNGSRDGLRCGSMTDSPRGEIEQNAAAPLRAFQLDELAIGGLICNDLWAPGCTPGGFSPEASCCESREFTIGAVEPDLIVAVAVRRLDKAGAQHQPDTGLPIL